MILKYYIPSIANSEVALKKKKKNERKEKCEGIKITDKNNKAKQKKGRVSIDFG